MRHNLDTEFVEGEFNPEELERRRVLADEADRIRTAFGPLAFSAVDLIREFRDGCGTTARDRGLYYTSGVTNGGSNGTSTKH